MLPPDPQERLRNAIELAKLGHRVEARELLLQLVAEDERNELAWLWLSDLVDSTDDQITALENALALNPNNSQVRKRLDGLRARRNEDAKHHTETTAALLQKAHAAAKVGHQQEARDILLWIVREDNTNATAWLMLSYLLPEVGDRVSALENVLTLDPQNAEAQARLAELRPVSDDPLTAGRRFEEQGQLDKAIDAYRAAQARARTDAERRQAQLALDDARLRSSAKRWRTVSPAVTFARLTAGPPLLYVGLVLVQGGFNPLRAHPLLWLGALVVVFGSLMVTAAETADETAPARGPWRALLASEARPTAARRSLHWLGMLLTVVPFALILADSLARLSVYRVPPPG